MIRTIFRSDMKDTGTRERQTHKKTILVKEPHQRREKLSYKHHPDSCQQPSCCVLHSQFFLIFFSVSSRLPTYFASVFQTRKNFVMFFLDFLIVSLSWEGHVILSPRISFLMLCERLFLDVFIQMWQSLPVFLRSRQEIDERPTHHVLSKFSYWRSVSQFCIWPHSVS